MCITLKEETANMWENIFALVIVVIIGVAIYGAVNGWFTHETEDPDQIFPVFRGDDPYLGDVDAPIMIVEYSDFQCPFCADFALNGKKVLDPYIESGKVIFVYKDMPLKIHAKAAQVANAAGCAYEQDKFWEYHDLIYANPDKLELGHLDGYAEELGLNMSDFKKCFSSERRYSEINDDLTEAFNLGVTATPTFFINGKKYVGVPDFESIIGELS